MAGTIELLGDQHQEALRRLADVETRLGGDDTAHLAGFVDFLRNDLALHFQLEEEALFPVLERYPHLAQGPVQVMNAEHVQFRQLVERLDGAVGAGDHPRQSQTARQIIDFLRSHIAKEDNVLLPVASRTLSEAEKKEVNQLAERLSAAT